jgi:hypothetical protein
MQCQNEGCDGNVNSNIEVGLQIGCGPTCTAAASPCSKCGRLHWPNGKAVTNRDEKKAFFRNKEIVIED